MASSPKKAHRPAVKLEQPPLPVAAPEPPAPEVSAPALLAAEVAVEPVTPPVAELVETAKAEAETVETAAEAVETTAAAVVAAPVAAPEPVKAEVKAFGDNVRALFEKGLVESRAKFAQAKTVAEETSAVVEASYGAARDGVAAFNVKAIEALKSGADANFDLIASMASAKSVAELVTLQSDFARKRLEETSSQAKALAELARKVADETVAPLKAHVAKTFKAAV